MTEEKEPNPAFTRKHKVRVFRFNCEKENQNDPIVVDVVGVSGQRKVFLPGQTVELSEAQIEILKNAKEDSSFEIEPTSGIYKARDPMREAVNWNPGFTPVQDPITGLITLTDSKPNYVIERSI